MATIPDHLLSLFTASLEYRGGRYYIEVPASEVSLSPGLDAQNQCQVAILSLDRVEDDGKSKLSSTTETSHQNSRMTKVSRQAPSRATARPSQPESIGSPQPYDSSRWNESNRSDPPVAENDILKVEIESMGSKGDGVAKVDSGYVLMIPDTEVGEEVTVEVESVQDTYSFARVV